MKKIILSSLLLGIISTLTSGAAAYAAKPVTTGSVKQPLGIDVSYPQCGQRLPSDHAFGIVGVNAGLATETNQCLGEQLVWASKAVGGTAQPKVQLYVNTANPGGLKTESWPRSDVDAAGNTPANPYGTCDGSDSHGCAWMYGWNRAIEDVRDRFQPAASTAKLDQNPSSYVWWLDVETENTWKAAISEFNTISNVAVLEGMASYFDSRNIKIGLYSTAYQWSQIVGNSVSASSNLNGLANWRPGGASLATAKEACNARPLTTSGTVVMTQYVSKGLDYNYVCR